MHAVSKIFQDVLQMGVTDLGKGHQAWIAQSKQ